MRFLLLVLFASAGIFAEIVEDNGNFVKEANLWTDLFEEFYSCLCDGDHQECVIHLSRDGDVLNVDEVERFGELENSNSDCKYFACSIAARGRAAALVCSQEMNATTACASGLEPQFIQLETPHCCGSTCVVLFWNNVNDKLLLDDPDFGVKNCSTECACLDTLVENTKTTLAPDDDESTDDPITSTAKPSSESTSYSPYSTSKTSSNVPTAKATVESTSFISNSTSSVIPTIESTTWHTSESSSKTSSNFPTAKTTTEASPQNASSSLNTSSLPNEEPGNETTYYKPESTTSSVAEHDGNILPPVLRFTENTTLNGFILFVIIVIPLAVVILVIYIAWRAWKRRMLRNSGDVIDVVELEHLKCKDQHV